MFSVITIFCPNEKLAHDMNSYFQSCNTEWSIITFAKGWCMKSFKSWNISLHDIFAITTSYFQLGQGNAIITCTHVCYIHYVFQSCSQS